MPRETHRAYARQLQDRAERLTALSTLTRLITSAAESREVFDAVARAATTLLGARMARVWVAEPADRVLRIQGSFGLDPGFDQLMNEFPAIPYGRGVVGEVFESRTPAYI